MDLYSPTDASVPSQAHLNGHYDPSLLPPHQLLQHEQLQQLPPPNPPPAAAAEAVPDYSHELPTVLNDLIPLSHILDRIISQAHHDLANLTETLPSAADQARKRAIVDYVLQTRRQILKLLVLVRWSSEAENLAKCMNIVGFLGRQNDEFDNSVTSLTSVKQLLAQARVRNSDLPTSLTVLRTGTYSGLPSVVREGFEQPEKLSDEAVLKTLSDVEEVLRWRLGSGKEVVPRAMRNWWIADGRVHFRVSGMWEATFTYGGGMDDPSSPSPDYAEEGAESKPAAQAQAAEWYLLSLKFLFRVRDARGVWSPTPTGPMKEHIIDLCNRELARRRHTPVEAETSTSASRKKNRDAPLVRGYNFLQRLALSYQLESLHQQALQLANTSWSASLKIEMNKERTELRLGYWCPPKPDTPQPPRNPAPGVQQPQQPPAPTAPATLIFSLSTSSSSSSSVSREKVLERILKGKQKQQGEEGEEEVAERLGVEWKAEGVEEGREELEKSGGLMLDSDLSLEFLLLRVTTLHATSLTHALYSHLIITFSSAPSSPTTITSNTSLELLPPSSHASPQAGSGAEGSVPSIHLHLFSTHSISLSISPLTGRLSLKSPGEISTSRESRLRSAADKINATASGTGGWGAMLQAAGDTLIRVRASTILDEVESRAAVLGLGERTTRRLPLRGVDLARFGADTRSCLFVKLAFSSSSGAGGGKAGEEQHYLVLVMTEHGFRFALIGTREGSDLVQSWVGITEVGWLERGVVGAKSIGEGQGWEVEKGEGEKERRAATYGFDVSIEDLRELHSYCFRRIAFHHLERQLHSRRIPFLTVSPSAPSSTNTTSPNDPTTQQEVRTPYLLLHSKDLLAAMAEGMGLGRAAKGLEKAVWENLALRCSVRGEGVKTSLTFRLRPSSLSLLLSPTSGGVLQPTSSMAVDAKTGVITLSSDEVDGTVGRFLSAYSLLMRSIVLARHRQFEAEEQKNGGGGGAPMGGEVKTNGL